ncbi:aryl-sulfate sulfotransferase, partial [Liquorilactobacillus vini]
MGHSYQLIGLIGGHKNQITITATTKAGTKTTKTFTYHAPQLVSKEANRLKVKNGSSTQKLTSGLYAFIGDKNLTQRATYLVDNDGYIRGEIPLIGYNSLRLVQRGNYLYFAVNNDQIVKMDRLGRIIKSYSTKKSGYEIHHDFAVDSSGNLISLATSLQAKKREKRVEDQIIKISGQTGKVTRLLDFKKLMPALYKKAT